MAGKFIYWISFYYPSIFGIWLRQHVNYKTSINIVKSIKNFTWFVNLMCSLNCFRANGSFLLLCQDLSLNFTYFVALYVEAIVSMTKSIHQIKLMKYQIISPCLRWWVFFFLINITRIAFLLLSSQHVSLINYFLSHPSSKL